MGSLSSAFFCRREMGNEPPSEGGFLKCSEVGNRGQGVIGQLAMMLF